MFLQICGLTFHQKIIKTKFEIRDGIGPPFLNGFYLIFIGFGNSVGHKKEQNCIKNL